MIPAIQELNFPKIDGKQYATLSHATANLADMGEKTISTQVKIDGDIVPDFSQDWEVAFQGEKYIMPLRLPQGAKENTSLNSTIDLTFQHWAIYQLKRWTFVTMQPIDTGTAVADEEVAPVQLNLKDFCDLFGQVLRYYYGDTITIDLNPAWQYDSAPTAIEINHSYIWNVLIDAFYDKYGVRWAIEPREDNDNTVKGGERYVIKIGYPTTEVDHIFEYGFEGGLLKIERQVQSEEIHNMIKGRGGDTNIPFRYFKDTDLGNPDFAPDPDWIEELKNIYFTNLMPATYRSYIQGWKAAHISKYPGYKAVGENNAYSPWAYRKGFTDTKFHPVEFVADEITLTPQEGDRQVQIYPDYSPYVKKGSSIDVYGPLLAPLDNNDDIYPTLQGTGLDIAVDVEQIVSDDVAESAESDAQIEDTTFPDIIRKNVAQGYTTVADASKRTYFSVPTGKRAIIEGHAGVRAYNPQNSEDKSALVAVRDYTIKVYNAVTGAQNSASGIPAGSWYFTVEYDINNTSGEALNVTCSFNGVKITSATPEDKWRNTFDIWVKDIWNSTRLAGETDSQYSERVWKPILGDREKNTAKVVFASGMLLHEDYEFTIVDFPVPDTSKTYTDSNGVRHDSHWRITLAKSDAELKATGLYVPSTQKQGKAGDTFAFIGTEMTHVPYVVDAEIRLDDWKKDHLGEVKEIKPTFVVTTDRVRLNNEGKPDALINQLRVGNSLRIADKRFVQPMGDRAYETLYLQSLTYTFREPTPEDAALNPDVEIVLSNEYATSANPVSVMQGEISAMQRLLGSISNVEQIVRGVGDRLYMRKDGIPEISYSPTRFFSLLTSGNFRAGIIGGAGWGFFKDENGNWVLEADRVNVRGEMQVNTLVINQAEGRGGMEVDTAAFMEVVRVVDADEGYVCYFDQKGGSVANLFHVDDVAYCNRWTAENQELKFYKRRVVAVGADYITLSKTDVNGTGIPAEKDNIIHYGNYTDKTRQYVKVRDVVGGGYESYIEGLDSVNAAGEEFYFVGRRAGAGPRWFIGERSKEYIEWKDGQLSICGRLSVLSTVGGKALGDFVRDEARGVQFALDVDGAVSGIACDAAGNVAGEYPQGRLTVYRGGARYEGDVVYRVVTTDGISALVDGEGVVSFKGITGLSASVAVEAVVVGEDVVLRGEFTRFKVLPGSAVRRTEVFYSSVFTASRPAESTFTLTSVPAVPAGMYLWSVVVTYYTDETSSRAYSVSRQGLDYGAGKMLFTDPTFKKGANGVQKYYYHDQNGAEVTVTRVSDSTAPNDSGMVLHISSHGELKPGVGGFSQVYRSAPNKVFVQRVIARIPKGYSVRTASVPIGTGGANYLLAAKEGTGKWEEYVRKFVCGSEGEFNALGYFYLEGPQGTEDSPVEWDVAYVTLFDMGANGEFGVEAKSVSYAKSVSSAQPADSAFVYGSIDEAGVSVGDFLWTRTSVTYSDGTTVTSYSVGRVGADGSEGTPGAAGADGRTSYVHWAYANSADGSEDFSTVYFAGAKYLGTCTTYDSKDPEDYRRYEWARLRGEDALVYSLLPSVGVVRRSPDGTFTPGTISCEKRLAKGDSVGLTTDYYLYYRFVTGEESAANWVIGAGPGRSTFESAIPSGARWVDFELRTNNGAGAMILASERVMVLTDAADMEVGGTNLLKNSDFIDGVRYWTNDVVAAGGSVAVLDRATAPGWLEGRATMHVRYVAGSAMWRSLYQRVSAGKVRAGEVYMLSGWVYVPSMTAMTKTVYAKIHRVLADGSSYNQELIDFRGVTAGRWCYVSRMWKAPATLDMGEGVWVMFQMEEYGEFYLNGWKFEQGNVATGWSASPDDVSYLRSALRESTTVDGGLIAATLLKLGYTLEGGEYRVTAGMNGVVTPEADDIAFWSGGPMVDAEREPEADEAATFVIRHSGEAYACGNTVRFKTNRIEVGAPGAQRSVVLDDDGLKLVDGSEERLRVVHQSVGSLADAASSQLISGPGVKSHVIYLRQVGGGSSSGGIQMRKSYQISRGFETAAFSVGSSGATLNAGAAVKMAVRVSFVYDTRVETSSPGIYDSYPLSGSVRVRVYSTAGTVLCNRSVALRTTDGRTHVGELSLNETVKTAGVYVAKVYLEGTTTGSESDAGSATATVSATGSVQLGYADQTVMGSDGFMTKWGNAALLARAGEVHAKVGTTELVVLESGIKAIVNGKEIWLAGG